MTKAFLDTNVVLYTLAEGDPRRPIARARLAQGGTISVHVLNEFATVARRKLNLSWPEVSKALAAVRALWPPASLAHPRHPRSRPSPGVAAKLFPV